MMQLLSGSPRHRRAQTGRVEVVAETDTPQRVRLRDGSSVTIRPIVPADAPH